MAVHWPRMTGLVEEPCDVIILSAARRPMALGFKTGQIRRMANLGEAG